MTAIYKGEGQLKEVLDAFRPKGVKIGFVPTMGALHQGHLSLLKQCLNENDISVCSIFVNPAQFNNKEDYNRYPRKLEEDIWQLSNANADIIFVPDAEEIYPGGNHEPVFSAGALAKTLEGEHRPGHFQGVITIIHKLFSIVNPLNAYFGQKDYQQFLIINQFAEEYFPGIHIKMVNTVRESSGLAMSSRNMLLDKKQKAVAANIYESLLHAKEQLKSGEDIAKIKRQAKKFLNNGLMQAEYFEIVDSRTLQPLTGMPLPRNILICTAVKVGNIRLIDNLLI